MGRKLTIKVFKYDPANVASKPHFREYTIEEAHSMTIFIVLSMIREQFDPDLNFDFVCRAGICGSCGMMINGQPRLACRTLTESFSDPVITLMPLPAFKLIKVINCIRTESFSAI